MLLVMMILSLGGYLGETLGTIRDFEIIPCLFLAFGIIQTNSAREASED